MDNPVTSRGGEKGHAFVRLRGGRMGQEERGASVLARISTKKAIDRRTGTLTAPW